MELHVVELPSGAEANWILSVRRFCKPNVGFKFRIDDAHELLRSILRTARARGDKLGRTVYRPVQYESTILGWIQKMVNAGMVVLMDVDVWKHKDAEREYEEQQRKGRG